MMASILEILWRQSWQAAVIAIIVMAIRPWIAPRWREGLWLVVLARLVLPTLPGARVSVFNLPGWYGDIKGRFETTPVADEAVGAPWRVSTISGENSVGISPLAPLGGERHAAELSRAADWTEVLAGIWLAGSSLGGDGLQLRG